ncbi:IS1 transposase [Shigella sonnei]|nr:IS1 transposase [Shigella sonnei]SVI95756.1 IS1 transposase [Shigella sonnei]
MTTVRATLACIRWRNSKHLTATPELHVISKRYTQRIERHNLNLRQHLARLGRKSLSFSKSVELHDKVIGHYLNIKHYQ